MNRFCCFVTVFILSGAIRASTSAGVNDWLIVPGKRVGPITPDFTRADLPRVFGAKNVKEDEIITADGVREQGTRVFADQADSSLAILWQDDDSQAHIRRIIVCENADASHRCRWHTADGLTIGSTLKMLEKINQHEFKVAGFEWGYGGLVTSWEGGRLQGVSDGCGSLTVRLDPAPAPASDERNRLLEAVEEDAEFPSSHAAMQSLNPAVDHLSVSFQKCERR